MEQTLFMRAPEVMEVLGVSDGMAYRIIRELNKELEAKGYHTVTGRVSRKYFEESYYGVIPEKEAV
jgi:hypothetical protein